MRTIPATVTRPWRHPVVQALGTGLCGPCSAPTRPAPLDATAHSRTLVQGAAIGWIDTSGYGLANSLATHSKAMPLYRNTLPPLAWFATGAAAVVGGLSFHKGPRPPPIGRVSPGNHVHQALVRREVEGIHLALLSAERILLLFRIAVLMAPLHWVLLSVGVSWLGSITFVIDIVWPAQQAAALTTEHMARRVHNGVRPQNEAQLGAAMSTSEAAAMMTGAYIHYGLLQSAAAWAVAYAGIRGATALGLLGAEVAFMSIPSAALILVACGVMAGLLLRSVVATPPVLQTVALPVAP